MRSQEISRVMHRMATIGQGKVLTSFLLPAALFALFLSSGFAQQSLPVDEIEVVKHFDAHLTEVQKIPLTPSLPAPDTNSIHYQYQLTLDTPAVQYPKPEIRPLALRPEEQPDSYRGFLRAGYGAPNAVLADGAYHILHEGPAQLSVSAHHHSINDKSLEHHQVSMSGGQIRGGYLFSPMFSFSGNIGYDYDTYYFYGVEKGDPTLYVDDHRNLKTFTAGVGLKNAEPLSGNVNYNAHLSLYNRQDDLGTEETGTVLKLGGSKVFQQRHTLELSCIADLSKLGDEEEERDLNNLLLHSAFTYQGHGFGITGGLLLTDHEGSVDLFPQARFVVDILGKTLMGVAEADGGLTKNTFRSLTDQNPFIHQHIRSIRNTLHRDYTIGVKGETRRLSYQGSVGLTMFRDLALFEADAFDYRTFQPLYDDGMLYRIEGSVQTTISSSTEVGMFVAKHFYDLDIQEKPWHLPTLDASLTVTHHSMHDKLHLHGEVEIQNGVPYMESGTAETLKGLFDISIAAEYYFSKHVGVFLHANNLLDNAYQRWQRYPVFGINGVVGVLVRI